MIFAGQAVCCVRGRFAPSPTGPLHFGSLVAALGSFLEARTRGGEWWVRLEDLDRARERPGAADAILHTLDAYGLHWDGSVQYQSRRQALYRDVLDRLGRCGLTYPCACSRTTLATQARRGPEGLIYPGTCRAGLAPGARARATRFRCAAGMIGFEDQVQGPVALDLARELGDFILLRADAVPAYQLAVVVDDHDQGINQVVRGADLLLSTLRQEALRRALDWPSPSYAHLPLALDSQGRKLSKSAQAYPVDARNPLPSLLAAWRFLGQAPVPREVVTLADFWSFAPLHWSLTRIPGERAQSSPSLHGYPLI